MNIDEFYLEFQNDRHSLSDRISKGEIPFDLCLEGHGRYGFPPLLLWAMMIHPKCTINFFRSNYPQLSKSQGSIFKVKVLPNAKVLENLEAIQVVVDAEEPTVDSIMSKYSMYLNHFLQMSKNPFLHKEIIIKIYEINGDDSILPEELKDMFIF